MDPFALLVAVVGLAVGSFLNVVIDRVPLGKTILRGRSHCDYCHTTLAWYELIPVLSWIIQSGRCRTCKRRLSVQYPLIELLTAAGFYLAALAIPPPLLLPGVFLYAVCLVLVMIDLKYFLLPDRITFFLYAVSLWWLVASGTDAVPIRNNHLATALGIAGFFLILWILTKKRGIGLGDVKLAPVIGLLLGFPNAVVALYAAFLTGAGVGVILMVTGRKAMQSKIAFGPFLLIGLGIAALWGDIILSWWQRIV
ncbi:prepilin peptidase [Patescibacteria group bacterium]|nr:prepilin peptidase [Patescibacteria group bacterium]